MGYDRRNAAGAAGDALDMSGVDACEREIFDRAVGEHVVADCGHHKYGSAQLSRGDRLICAFAAVAHFETPRLDRLASDRHAVHIGHEIDVVAADHGYARLALAVHASPLLFASPRRRESKAPRRPAGAAIR